jgi:copper transport protein
MLSGRLTAAWSSRRRLARATVCLVATVAAVVLSALPASAHAVLEQTTPAAGATVDLAPDQVWLRFNQTVGADAESVRVLDPAGQRVDQADARPGDTGDQIVDDLRPGLGRGVYVVVWKVVSADGHPISGSYLMGVGVAVGRAQVSSGGSGGTGPASVAVLAGVLRFAFQGALALLLGAGFFLLVVWPGGLDLPAMRRLLLASWLASLASAVGLLLVQGPYAASLPLTDALRPSVLSQVWHSRFGHVSQVRLILLIAALGLVWTFPRRRHNGQFEAAALAGGLAIAWATIGHASDGGLTAVTVPMLSLHAAAVAVWLGGLVVLALFGLRPGPAADLEKLLRRWLRVATVCVVVMTVTGLILTWRDVGTLPALPATLYGRLLLVKLALYAVVMAVAWTSHRWVLRRWAPVVSVARPTGAETAADPGTPSPALAVAGQTRTIRTRIAVEIVIATLIFVVTAALANTKTARMAYAPQVPSTWRGPQDLILQIRDAAGGPVRAQAAQAALTLPDKAVGPLTVQFGQPATDGRLVGHAVLPYPGTWYVHLTVRVDDFEEYTAVTSYRVH